MGLGVGVRNPSHNRTTTNGRAKVRSRESEFPPTEDSIRSRESEFPPTKSRQQSAVRGTGFRDLWDWESGLETPPTIARLQTGGQTCDESYDYEKENGVFVNASENITCACFRGAFRDGG